MREVEAAAEDPETLRLLAELLDGRARTARELRAVEGASAAALAALQRIGLVEVVDAGRHRYFALRAPSSVRRALPGIAPATFVPSTPLPLRTVRSCYGHLAGTVAVAWLQHMLEDGWLGSAAPGFEVTGRGRRRLREIGVDVVACRYSRRRFAPACLDWSERRPHLGGALGAALLQAFLEQGWMVRIPGARNLRLMAPGRRALAARRVIEV